MMTEIQRLMDEYWAWLRDRTVIRQVDDQWAEITTPYLDRHNDCIQIYTKRHNGGYLLMDDGDTIQNLRLSGCSLDTPKRKALLNVTLNGFGVAIDKHDVLRVQASSDNFALRKHSLLQAMLAVNDLFYLAAPQVASLFYEDVVAWLDQAQIRYTPRVKFAGKSGYDHLFDFVIPKSRSEPERILRAINRPDSDTAKSLMFSWLDTRKVRPSDSKAYAFLNNTERSVSPDVVQALRNYNVTPVLWDERDAVKSELAA